MASGFALIRSATATAVDPLASALLPDNDDFRHRFPVPCGLRPMRVRCTAARLADNGNILVTSASRRLTTGFGVAPIGDSLFVNDTNNFDLMNTHGVSLTLHTGTLEFIMKFHNGSTTKLRLHRLSSCMEQHRRPLAHHQAGGKHVISVSTQRPTIMRQGFPADVRRKNRNTLSQGCCPTNQ